MSALVCFGTSALVDLSTEVTGDHIQIKSEGTSQLTVMLSLDAAEEHAAELNAAIATLRANRQVGRK